MSCVPSPASSFADETQDLSGDCLLIGELGCKARHSVVKDDEDEDGLLELRDGETEADFDTDASSTSQFQFQTIPPHDSCESTLLTPTAVGCLSPGCPSPITELCVSAATDFSRPQSRTPHVLPRAASHDPMMSLSVAVASGEPMDVFAFDGSRSDDYGSVDSIIEIPQPKLKIVCDKPHTSEGSCVILEEEGDEAQETMTFSQEDVACIKSKAEEQEEDDNNVELPSDSGLRIEELSGDLSDSRSFDSVSAKYADNDKDDDDDEKEVKRTSDKEEEVEEKQMPLLLSDSGGTSDSLPVTGAELTCPGSGSSSTSATSAAATASILEAEVETTAAVTDSLTVVKGSASACLLSTESASADEKSRVSASTCTLKKTPKRKWKLKRSRKSAKALVPKSKSKSDESYVGDCSSSTVVAGGSRMKDSSSSSIQLFDVQMSLDSNTFLRLSRASDLIDAMQRERDWLTADKSLDLDQIVSTMQRTPYLFSPSSAVSAAYVPLFSPTTTTSLTTATTPTPTITTRACGGDTSASGSSSAVRRGSDSMLPLHYSTTAGGGYRFGGTSIRGTSCSDPLYYYCVEPRSTAAGDGSAVISGPYALLSHFPPQQYQWHSQSQAQLPLLSEWVTRGGGRVSRRLRHSLAPVPTTELMFAPRGSVRRSCSAPSAASSGVGTGDSSAALATLCGSSTSMPPLPGVDCAGGSGVSGGKPHLKKFRDAIYAGNLERVKSCVEACTSRGVPVICFGTALMSYSHRMISPLGLACRRGHIHVAEFLLSVCVADFLDWCRCWPLFFGRNYDKDVVSDGVADGGELPLETTDTTTDNLVMCNYWQLSTAQIATVLELAKKKKASVECEISSSSSSVEVEAHCEEESVTMKKSATTKKKSGVPRDFGITCMDLSSDCALPPWAQTQSQTGKRKSEGKETVEVASDGDEKCAAADTVGDGKRQSVDKEAKDYSECESRRFWEDLCEWRKSAILTENVVIDSYLKGHRQQALEFKKLCAMAAAMKDQKSMEEEKEGADLNALSEVNAMIFAEVLFVNCVYLKPKPTATAPMAEECGAGSGEHSKERRRRKRGRREEDSDTRADFESAFSVAFAYTLVVSRRRLPWFVCDFIKTMVLNAYDGDKRTALSHAVEKGHYHMVKWLVDSCGALSLVAPMRRPLGALNLEKGGEHHDELWTPLHYAARYGHASVLSLLVKQGADIDALTTKKKSTALHLGCATGNLAAVKRLLQLGAKTYLEDMYLCTPLSLAIHFQEKLVQQALFNTQRVAVSSHDARRLKKDDHMFRRFHWIKLQRPVHCAVMVAIASDDEEEEDDEEEKGKGKEGGEHKEEEDENLEDAIYLGHESGDDVDVDSCSFECKDETVGSGTAVVRKPLKNLHTDLWCVICGYLSCFDLLVNVRRVCYGLLVATHHPALRKLVNFKDSLPSTDCIEYGADHKSMLLKRPNKARPLYRDSILIGEVPRPFIAKGICDREYHNRDVTPPTPAMEESLSNASSASLSLAPEDLRRLLASPPVASDLTATGSDALTLTDDSSAAFHLLSSFQSSASTPPILAPALDASHSHSSDAAVASVHRDFTLPAFDSWLFDASPRSEQRSEQRSEGSETAAASGSSRSRRVVRSQRSAAAAAALTEEHTLSSIQEHWGQGFADRGADSILRSCRIRTDSNGDVVVLPSEALDAASGSEVPPVTRLPTRDSPPVSAAATGSRMAHRSSESASGTSTPFSTMTPRSEESPSADDSKEGSVSETRRHLIGRRRIEGRGSGRRSSRRRVLRGPLDASAAELFRADSLPSPSYSRPTTSAAMGDTDTGGAELFRYPSFVFAPPTGLPPLMASQLSSDSIGEALHSGTRAAVPTPIAPTPIAEDSAAADSSHWTRQQSTGSDSLVLLGLDSDEEEEEAGSRRTAAELASDSLDAAISQALRGSAAATDASSGGRAEHSGSSAVSRALPPFTDIRPMAETPTRGRSHSDGSAAGRRQTTASSGSSVWDDEDFSRFLLSMSGVNVDDLFAPSDGSRLMRARQRAAAVATTGAQRRAHPNPASVFLRQMLTSSTSNHSLDGDTSQLPSLSFTPTVERRLTEKEKEWKIHLDHCAAFAFTADFAPLSLRKIRLTGYWVLCQPILRAVGCLSFIVHLEISNFYAQSLVGLDLSCLGRLKKLRMVRQLKVFPIMRKSSTEAVADATALSDLIHAIGATALTVGLKWESCSASSTSSTSSSSSTPTTPTATGGDLTAAVSDDCFGSLLSDTSAVASLSFASAMSVVWRLVFRRLPDNIRSLRLHFGELDHGLCSAAVRSLICFSNIKCFTLHGDPGLGSQLKAWCAVFSSWAKLRYVVLGHRGSAAQLVLPKEILGSLPSSLPELALNVSQLSIDSVVWYLRHVVTATAFLRINLHVTHESSRHEMHFRPIAQGIVQCLCEFPNLETAYLKCGIVSAKQIRQLLESCQKLSFVGFGIDTDKQNEAVIRALITSFGFDKIVVKTDINWLIAVKSYDEFLLDPSRCIHPVLEAFDEK